MKSQAQMYDELLQQSKARRDENIVDHKARTARILNGKGRRSRLSPRAAAAQTPLDLLAIGDSWFEYPLYDNGPIPDETGIVAPVQLQSMGNPPPQILNLAVHGQATTAMLSWENQETLVTLLQDPSQWLNQQTNLPDAILVSAGGDDVVGDQFVIYLDYGGGGLNANRFQGALELGAGVLLGPVRVPRPVRPKRAHFRPLLRLRASERRPSGVRAERLAAAVARVRRLQLHARRCDRENHDRHVPRHALRACGQSGV